MIKIIEKFPSLDITIFISRSLIFEAYCYKKNYIPFLVICSISHCLLYGRLCWVKTTEWLRLAMSREYQSIRLSCMKNIDILKTTSVSVESSLLCLFFHITSVPLTMEMAIHRPLLPLSSLLICHFDFSLSLSPHEAHTSGKFNTKITSSNNFLAIIESHSNKSEF